MTVRILVIGFSVSAETPGYVEQAAKLPGIRARYQISKVALGGVHLHQLQYLLNQIVTDNDMADFYVLEVATSAIRVLPAFSLYPEALAATLAFFTSRELRLAIFDLPRRDIDTDTDALLAMHQSVCDAQSLPYSRVALDTTQLKDDVHPTPEGQRRYASAFAAFLERVTAALPATAARSWSKARAAPLKTSIAIAGVISPPHARTVFNRSGYVQEFVELEAGSSIEIAVPKGQVLTGLSYLIGPRSGRLAISGETVSGAPFERTITCYDQFAYYTRLGVRLFPPVTAERVRIVQLPDQPDIELLKGEKYLGDRLGAVGHLLLTATEAGS